MIFLGADPDLHALGLAAVDETMRVRHVAVLRVSQDLTEQRAILQMISELTTHLEFHARTPGHHVCGWAVESQEIYRIGASRTQNPRSLLHLGHVSGAVAAYWSIHSPAARRLLPCPQEWKGSVDKLVMQRRILIHAGLGDHPQKVMGGKDPYVSLIGSTIPGAETLNAGDWKHVIDAIGLAQYAAKTHLADVRKVNALAAAEASRAA